MSLSLIFWTRSPTNSISHTDHVKIRTLFEPIEKFTDWEWFQSLTSDLISPKIQINSGVEADKAVRDFTASIASACRLSTSKITLFSINNDLPGLDRLLKHKQKLKNYGKKPGIQHVKWQLIGSRKQSRE
jgi:hypothetical protein